MDKKTYIEGKGIFCPFCKDESIQGGFVQVEAGKAFQEMGCIACDKKWQDIYQLVEMIPIIEQE